MDSTSGRFSGSLTIDALQYPVPDRRWFEEWQAGQVSCVHVTVAIWENARDTLRLLGTWQTEADRNRDIIRIASSAEEIEENHRQGLISVVLGFQNTAPIEHDIEYIQMFRRMGVCIMQLTYNLQNYIGAGYWEDRDSGLSSRFGRAAIDEMNRVGVLIDLSHCGDRTTREAIEYSARPVAVTHSNPREFASDVQFGAKRLKEIASLKLMAEKGGVIGLCPNRAMMQNGVRTTLAEFSDLVAWTADRLGVDSIGIGLDYCPGHSPAVRTWWRYARWSRELAPSTTQAPHEGWQDWLRSPADTQNLRAGLASRGFTEAEIEKIMGENWLRLFRESFRPQLDVTATRSS